MRNISLAVKVVIILVGLACLLPGCGSKEEKLAHFLKKGDRLLAAKDPVSAILEYKNALQIDPRSGAAKIGLGKAYIAQEEYQRAYSSFKSALELDPELDDARIEVAWLLAMGKEGQMALDELARIRQPDARQPRVDIIRARALMDLQRFQEAIDILKNVKDADANKEVQIFLANSHKAVRSYEAMESAVKRWKDIDKDSPAPYLFMAQWASEAGKRDTAVARLDEMVKEKNNEKPLMVLRAQSLEKFGLQAEAEKAFEELPDDPDMLAVKADFWIRQGKPAKARPALEKLVAAFPNDTESKVKLASVTAGAGDVPSALELVENALKGDLKKADRERLFLAKASLMAHKGDLPEAIVLCEAAVKENQANMDAHLLLGKLLWNVRRTEEAEIHLNQVAAARPKDEDVQIMLARCLRVNKKSSLAEDTLKRALEQFPKSAALRLELAGFYHAGGEYEQMEKVLEKGLELQPDDPLLLKARGDYRLLRKDYARAEGDYRRIIELRPELAPGYMRMGESAVAQSRLDDAIAWFLQAAEREGGRPDALSALTATYVRKGDATGAAAFLRKEAELHPGSALVPFLLGQVYQFTGNLEKAEESYLRACALEPRWTEPYRGLAEVYMRQGKQEEALARMEEAYKRESSLPLCMQLAALYERAGRYQDAIRLYEDQVRKENPPPALLNNLAYLYAEHSRDKAELAKASDLAARALAQDPENPGFLDTFGWIAYKSGDPGTALNYIQNALFKDPNEGLHHVHAALIHHDLGESRKALEHLDKALQQKLDDGTKARVLSLKSEWAKGGRL